MCTQFVDVYHIQQSCTNDYAGTQQEKKCGQVQTQGRSFEAFRHYTNIWRLHYEDSIWNVRYKCTVHAFIVPWQWLCPRSLHSFHKVYTSMIL